VRSRIAIGGRLICDCGAAKQSCVDGRERQLWTYDDVSIIPNHVSLSSLRWTWHRPMQDTCGDEIAQLEAWADQLSGQPVPKAHLPQSIDAQLHHQPTVDSVRRAEENAQLRIAPILAVAKMLNTAGKSSECLQSVAEAKRLLGIY